MLDNITLNIYTPEGSIFEGMVSAITLPGSIGTFTILNNHSPIISSLEKGTIKYTVKGETTEVGIQDGFVEGKGNTVTVCIESIVK